VSAVNHAMNLQGSVVGLNGLATLSYRHLKARLQPNIESQQRLVRQASPNPSASFSLGDSREVC
jgi:hypothetical protein